MTAQAKYKEMVRNVIRQLENGDVGFWIKPWKVSFPLNCATKRRYSGLNVLFLWHEAAVKGYRINEWLTYKQVEKLGGKVKKDERSTSVFFFTLATITKEDEQSGEVVEKTIPVMRMYHVFNVEQTTLKPDAPSPSIAIEDNGESNERLSDIDILVENAGITIVNNYAGACYVPECDTIFMPYKQLFESEDHYYSTLLHEMAHWTGHETRLNRELKNRFGSTKYAFEELVAETTSMFLNAHFGIDYRKMRHTSYLSSWIAAMKAKPIILWQAASKAQKAFNYLLTFEKETLCEASKAS